MLLVFTIFYLKPDHKKNWYLFKSAVTNIFIILSNLQFLWTYMIYHLYFHLLNEYCLNICYVPNSVIDARDKNELKNRNGFSLVGAYNSEG